MLMVPSLGKAKRDATDMTPFEQGQHDAFVQVGLIKTAIPLGGPGILARAGSWLKPKALGLGRMLFGQPKKFVGELAKGQALGKGGLIRQGLGSAFSAKNPLSIALNYGLPAYQLYGIAKSNDPNKAEQIGGFAGSTLAGAAMSRPFGMVGSIAGSMLGSRIGSGVVGAGRKLLGKELPPPVQPNPEQLMQQQMQQARAAQQAGNYPRLYA
jgi:hypothetical protein